MQPSVHVFDVPTNECARQDVVDELLSFIRWNLEALSHLRKSLEVPEVLRLGSSSVTHRIHDGETLAPAMDGSK